MPIYRASPIYVNVQKMEFLDGGYVEHARVVDDLGSFAIEIKFNSWGAVTLDGITTDNRGCKRIAVMCTFGSGPRWLGAPIIKQRISDGMFTFTPDATREEADRIVKGLNDVAKALKRKRMTSTEHNIREGDIPDVENHYRSGLSDERTTSPRPSPPLPWRKRRKVIAASGWSQILRPSCTTVRTTP